MIDIISYLPTKHKKSPSGWISFNAPCCVYRGESEDKRGRAGIIVETDGSFRFHCFNCSLSTGFEIGKPLSKNAKKLLAWLGVDQNDIAQLNLESLKHRSVQDILGTKKTIGKWVPEFEKRTLPDGLDIINPEEPLHQTYIDYLVSRGIDYTKYPYMVSPHAPSRNKRRIVIPYTYDNTIVGYTARYFDDRRPKYYGDVQAGYVFGTDLQHPDWIYVIVVEGIFDALCIDGLALLHNDINDRQAALIKTLNKKVIVVPDQDKAGITIIDKAVELGWAVSIPEWGDGCKDVNDAVLKYGRLGTILSIIESSMTSKIKIELSKKRLQKRIKLR